MPHIFLPDRCFISVSGKDAEDFLQGLITTDLLSLADGDVRPGALLTPQGKLLFDFLIAKTESGFVLETDDLQRDSLIKRLSMYKLRAEVVIVAESDSGALVSWAEPAPAGALKDFRFEKAGLEVFRSPAASGPADRQAYDDLRIQNGIAESGRDFQLSDAFPHDVLLDLNGGVSFRKGCYVGQEVVSRMQHRSTARRRVVILEGPSALTASGTDLMVDGKVIGTLGTVSGNIGLALARIDRVGEAQTQGSGITVGGIVVAARLPGWSGLSFPRETDEATA